MTESRKLARDQAADSIARGQPLQWFEDLYRAADGDCTAIPWADMTVNPNLAEWLGKADVRSLGEKALVVGCGLGDDAAALAALGMEVTAFDISATCVQWCRRRFSNSNVKYSVADLFDSPCQWRQAFDFIFEAYTLQVLPPELRRTAMNRISQTGVRTTHKGDDVAL